MEPSSREKPTRSLIEILHEAPALLEALPPAALKSLSSTCKTLRTSFYAQVRTITLSCCGDASQVFCTTWPNLLMVACPHECEMKSKLPAQWEYTMDIQIRDQHWKATAVLIRSQQQPHTPSSDLSRQHCAVLSDFCEKHRSSARAIYLHGPHVGCRVLQSLMHSSQPQLESIPLMDSPQLSDSCCSVTNVSISGSFLNVSALLQMGTTWPRLQHLDLSNTQLDANAVWALTQVKWTDLDTLYLDVNNLGTSGVQHLVSCSWPSLVWLSLNNTCIDAPALQCLAQGQWPELTDLSLQRNCVDATGISYLMKGCWPRLYCLSLSVQDLDDKAYSLLGILEKEKCSVMATPHSAVNNTACNHYSSHLPHFPYLQVWFWYDQLVQS